MRYTRLLSNARLAIFVAVCVISIGAADSQPWIAASPVPGNPATIPVRFYLGTNNITLIINSDAGQVTNSCYVYLTNSWQGFRVWLYDTSTSTPSNPQIGAPGWQSVLSTASCSIDLAQTTWDPYVGVDLRVTPAVASTKQIVASYWYRYCDEYCNNEFGTSTIGYWTPGASPGGARLVSPVPGTELTGTSATFSWNSVTGASYCFRLGDSPGGLNYANQCTNGASLNVANIPGTGEPVYGGITTYFSEGGSALNEFVVGAANQSTVGKILTPATGTVVSGSSMLLTWQLGVNVNSYRVAVGTNPGGSEIADVTLPATQANFRIEGINRFGAAYVYVTLQSNLPSGTARRTAAYPLNAGAPLNPGVITSPADGSTLSGTSFTFNWTPLAVPSTYTAKYFLTVGRTPGATDIFPDVGQGVLLTGTSQFVSIPVALGGRPMFASLYSLTCPASGPCTSSVNSYRYETALGTPSIGPDASAAELIVPASGQNLAAGAKVRFEWSSGTGVDEYWLTIGTAINATDLYYSYNGRRPEPLTSRSVSLNAIPAGVNRIYVALYSRIGNSWFRRDYERVVTVGSSGSLPAALYSCIAITPGESYPLVARTCTLPGGVYFIGSDGSQGTGAAVNSPIVVTRSNTTITGPLSGPRTRLVRLRGCAPLVSIGAGIQSVTVKELDIDGNNEALANLPACMDHSSHPQPSQSNDMHIKGPGVQNITVQNVSFEDALGRSLSIEAPGVTDIAVTGSSFINAALTGILIYGPGEPSTTQACDATTSPDPATDSNRPRRININGGLFIDSWTGAIANNYGHDVNINGAYFTHNYFDPYDQAGGTIFYDLCTIKSTVTGSFFNGAGLTTATEGLEIHGKEVTIENSTFAGYPTAGITLHSAKKVVIRNNEIHNNGSYEGLPSAPWKNGVTLNQRLVAGQARRAVEDVLFDNNRINNDSNYPGICAQPGVCTQTVSIGFRFADGATSANSLINIRFSPTLTPGSDTNILLPAGPFPVGRNRCKDTNLVVEVTAPTGSPVIEDCAPQTLQ